MSNVAKGTNVKKTPFVNFTGNKTLPKTLETKYEILNKRYRKPEGTTT
jgi:hypothetical protein